MQRLWSFSSKVSAFPTKDASEPLRLFCTGVYERLSDAVQCELKDLVILLGSLSSSCDSELLTQTYVTGTVSHRNRNFQGSRERIRSSR